MLLLVRPSPRALSQLTSTPGGSMLHSPKKDKTRVLITNRLKRTLRQPFVLKWIVFAFKIITWFYDGPNAPQESCEILMEAIGKSIKNSDNKF